MPKDESTLVDDLATLGSHSSLVDLKKARTRCNKRLWVIQGKAEKLAEKEKLKPELSRLNGLISAVGRTANTNVGAALGQIVAFATAAIQSNATQLQMMEHQAEGPAEGQAAPMEVDSSSGSGSSGSGSTAAMGNPQAAESGSGSTAAMEVAPEPANKKMKMAGQVDGSGSKSGDGSDSGSTSGSGSESGDGSVASQVDGSVASQVDGSVAGPADDSVEGPADGSVASQAVAPAVAEESEEKPFQGTPQMIRIQELVCDCSWFERDDISHEMAERLMGSLGGGDRKALEGVWDVEGVEVSEDFRDWVTRCVVMQALVNKIQVEKIPEREAAVAEREMELDKDDKEMDDAEEAVMKRQEELSKREADMAKREADMTAKEAAMKEKKDKKDKNEKKEKKEKSSSSADPVKGAAMNGDER